MTLPVGENGEDIEVWTVVDSGVVDADGIARTASPPFPGFSDRGNVLVARGGGPTGTIRINIDALFAGAMIFAPAIGIAATGGLAGAIIGLELAALGAAVMVLPIAAQAVKIAVWRDWASGERSKVELDVIVDPLKPLTEIYAKIPPPPSATAGSPVVTEATTTVDASGKAHLVIKGKNFRFGTTGGATRVSFRMGDRLVSVNATATGTQEDGQITVEVPRTVLLGASDIFVERRAHTGNWLSSQAFTVANKGGYAFLGGRDQLNNTAIQVIDLTADDDEDLSAVIKRITIQDNGQLTHGAIMDTVTTPDLSRAYVATDLGVAVIDTMTLLQYDVDQKADGTQLIKLPQNSVARALALDPKNRFLYVAGTGAIHVIDIRPHSAKFNQVVDTIEINAPDNGKINSIAVNPDGTTLAVAVPNSGMFTSTSTWLNGGVGKKNGEILFINVNADDYKEDNFRTVIGKVNGFMEPFEIKASADPRKFVFTSRGDLNAGFHVINIIDLNPDSFKAELNTKQISMVLNAEHIGIKNCAGPTRSAGSPSRAPRRSR